ncbi:hypothetical protein PsYK624_158310 [Phanerochaete sordida]|uniref:Uncharacterized protein n=1 Tax=Phanerochaete sordida TaxID=48140 RepID=A0A9P3LMC5_9APHY|nr:hypothetical protein PsYK624_158310 [Phanerochaete sordida]
MNGSYLRRILFCFLLAHCWPTSAALNISWIRPAAGDVYGAGSQIIGEWQSDTGYPSPSFRLCNEQAGSSTFDGSDGEDGGCGAAVKPSVQRDANSGSYLVTLTVPQVLQECNYVLEMYVDAGSSVSPSFSLSPSPSSEAQPDGAARSPASTAYQAMPDLAQTRAPVSPAAYAVPLSIAGVIIVLAGVICVVQRRELLRERAETHEESKRFQSMFHGTGGFLRRFTIRRFTLRRPQSDSQLPSVGRAPSIPESILEEKNELADEGDRYTRVYVPHSDRRPRPATKEPFYTTTTGRNMAAHSFQTQLSPRVPHSPSHAPAASRVRTPQRLGLSTTGHDASITSHVVDRYLRPSPRSTQLRGPTPSPAQKAHVRRHAAGASWASNPPRSFKGDIYDEVARRLG